MCSKDFQMLSNNLEYDAQEIWISFFIVIIPSVLHINLNYFSLSTFMPLPTCKVIKTLFLDYFLSSKGTLN